MNNTQQPEIIIGLIGSVSNGKSTLVKATTGTTTQRHAKEKQSNKTIRVGYANIKFFKCTNCAEPECYKSVNSSEVTHLCEVCGTPCDFQTHVSFTDVPGHNLYMATMLNGTCAMDYAIIVESCANEQIPSAQTIEHYEILRKKGIRTVLVCLNKVDLMVKFPKKVKQLMEILRNFVFDREKIIVPVIPISGTLNCNIDIVREYICKLPIPLRDTESKPKLFAIRSFNVNLPKTPIENLKGGVIGGCLKRGVLKVGDQLTLSPGYTHRGPDGGWENNPINCRVLTIDSEQVELDYATQGGLIGVQLDIDPALAGNDKLVGQMLYSPCESEKYKVYEQISILYTILKNITINCGDNLQINVNANNVMATVCDIDDTIIRLSLEFPICVENEDSVTLSVASGGGGINIFASGKIVDGI